MLLEQKFSITKDCSARGALFFFFLMNPGLLGRLAYYKKILKFYCWHTVTVQMGISCVWIRYETMKV